MAGRQTTIQKHQAVYKYFTELFEIKRLRYDDSIAKTAKHFFYQERTVEDIIRVQQKVM